MRTHRMRWIVVASLAMLPIMATASARADTCPPLDPTCVVGDAVESGGGTIDDTAETVEDTIEGTAGLDVGGPIDAVPPVEGGGQPPVDDDGGAGNPGSGGDDRRWNDDRGSMGSNQGNAAPTRGPDAGSSTTIAAGVAAPRNPSIATAVDQLRQTSPISDRVAAAAVGAAKSLAVVLGLMGAAVAFVLIQNRLDAKDPRLALAPHRSDVVRFG
jgi:hypothetical protein